MRPIQAAALCLGVALAQAPAQVQAQDQDRPCQAPLCLQDQDLRIEITGLAIRDSVVNVAVSYTNVQPEDYVLTQYSIYLQAVSEAGERLDLSTLRIHKYLGIDASRSDAYSLKFNEPIGATVDLIFHFENPDASYAFLGLSPEMFLQGGV